MSEPALPSGDQVDGDRPSAELRVLLDRLNSQLGIILAHAEVLESSTPAEPCRTRSSLIVTAALEAMSTSREITLHL